MYRVVPTYTIGCGDKELVVQETDRARNVISSVAKRS